MPDPPSGRLEVYTRPLPGGGFVAVDALARDGTHRARLWVERRADPGRRIGHAPPVIVERTAADLDTAVGELLTIAGDNVALAVAMRRWARARL